MAKNSKVWAGITLFGVLATSVAQAQLNGPVFRDNFDLYANDTELGAVWSSYNDQPSGELSTDQSVSPPNSLFSTAMRGAARYHVFADAGNALLPTDADPIVFKFQFYDTETSANTRKTGTILSSSGWSAQTDWWIEFGAYGNTSYTQYCIRTVNLGGPNWQVYPGSTRSIGWHSMRVEVGATFIRFTLDALPPYQVAVTAGTKAFTTVALGGPSNLYSAAGSAYYDDIHVSYLSDENACGSCGFVPEVSIDEILLSGANTVTVSNINPNALQVNVYSSPDGQEPWTLIGSSTAAPFASSTAISVSPVLNSGDWITATQSMEMIIPGCPTEILESCKIGDPVNVVDACLQIPEISVVGLVDAGRSSVLIGGVDSTAEAVKVYAYDPGTDTTTLIGTNSAPGGASLVQVDVSPALVQGQVIRATQTLLGLEGCMPTGGRGVGAPGVIEDFEGPVSRYDHPSPGVSGTWYDASAVSYTDVLIPPHARATLLGSRCVNITDHGWTNGAYVIYENIIPADGTYHLTLDMLIDEYEGCDYDFYNQYKVGVIVNGVHREPTGGIIPDILSPIGSYPCLTPNRDGADATEPIKVYVDTFTANAGDSLLIAFSTTLEGYIRSKTATPAGYVGMKVDNITLVDGPKPPNCLDVPVVEVVPTEFYPFEAGVTKVTARNIDPNATQVRLFADDVEIGTANPGGATQLDINVTPLVAGTTLTGTQTVGGMESCQCPGAAGPMVGEGKNSGVLVTLGIRETGSAGGSTGPIEWVGASAKGVGGQPLGKELPTSPAWQEMTFAWPLAGGTDPVVAFSGNGVVEGDFGVLESLNFTINSENNGRYVLYIDSIMNGDTLIDDFEAYTTGNLAVFRRPRNSGSTDSNLLAYPDIAEVDGSEAADGTKSYRVEWQFLDNFPKRWLRLTTVGGEPVLPGADPLIDLTKPITVKFLLYGEPPCGLVWADDDKDGDVDMDDFAALQRCLTIGVTSGDVPDECLCFDHPFDGAIGADDVASFINCAAGPGVVLESCP